MGPPAADGALVAVSRPDVTGAADPLSHLLAVLRPRALVEGAVVGDSTREVRELAGYPSAFCMVTTGRGVVESGERGICIAYAGDFIVLPDASRFTVTGVTWDARCLIGALEFDCVDPSLFTALLPPVLHLRGSVRQEWLASMMDKEASWEPAGNPVMLDRLLEVMLVDALREATAGRSPPGLLQGMGDARLVPALHGIHSQLDHPWTVAELAGLTDLRRSAFHVRFTQRLGLSPMDYLLFWRMLVAKDLLRGWVRGRGVGGRGKGLVTRRARRGNGLVTRRAAAVHEMALCEVARRVGYSGAASFIRAFHRHVGQTPGEFVRSLPGSPLR